MRVDSRRLAAWLRNYVNLGWTDRVEVVRVFCLAGLVELGLRTLPLRRVAGLLRVSLDLASPDRGRPMESALPEWAARRIQIVRLVLRHTGQTCLRNSLVVATRLRALSPTVRIGVRRRDGKMSAHAWVEVDGQFYDMGALEYEPVFSPPHLR